MENNADNVALLEMPALAGLIASTPVVERADGEALFQSGESCTNLPLIVSGNASVYATDKAGRQVTLYRLKPGDICPISLSALLQHGAYPAAASAETTVQLRYLPGEKLKAAFSSTPEIFSAFLDTFADCLFDSMCAARQLMLDPLDARPEYLLGEPFSTGPDQATNPALEDVANVIGTIHSVRQIPIE